MVADRVHLPGDPGCNPAGKVTTIVAGMLAGADSIDDLNIARHGGMPSLFTGVYAPSTLGSFLRTFTHGHVRQLQAAARDTLIGLAGRVPLLEGADVLTLWTSTRCCAASTADRNRAPGSAMPKSAATTSTYAATTR